MEYYRATTAFNRLKQQTTSSVSTNLGGGTAPMDISAIEGKGKGYKGKGKHKAKAKERAREDTRVKGKDTKVTERVQLVKAILVDQKDNHRSR